jgi:hypothetical protein
VLTEWLMERSRYSWIFDEVFAKEGIPREMSLLAPVISGLKGRTSVRPGGMGWWSLTGLCGAAEGVEMAVDSWHDDRLDPDLSTRCFAQRLKETRKELNSSGWLMPVSAYLTSVKIIQDQKSRWNTEVFWDLPLPDIAEELVVRWIAFRIIDDHRAFYGLKFVDAPALAFDQLSGVVLSKDLSIAEMARIADAPAREILELNAKIKPSQPIFPAKVQGKPHAHTIFAPKGKGRALIDKLKDEGYLANVEGR